MIGQIGLETGESQLDQSVSSAVIRYLSPGGLQQSQDLSQSPGGVEVVVLGSNGRGEGRVAVYFSVLSPRLGALKGYRPHSR